jgi:hypothetical protein
MKVRIVNNPEDDTLWYNNKVGNIYTIYNIDIEPKMLYNVKNRTYNKMYIVVVYVRDDNGYINYINVEDLEYVNE